MARWSAYDLTTVRQEIRLLARAAVDLALTRIAEPRRPVESRVLACELIVRGSTGNAPAS
jgi:DNA-binding LacI/PurR family transcriptional regulator